jgi:hypothetical protein
MTEYVVWYQKKIQAKNIKEAIKKEPKTKSQFHSIVEKEEPEIQQGTSAIGFETYDPEQYDQ